VPTCAACGALRPPLSGPSVNLAGKPSKFGGVVAGILGWLVLLVGLSIALGLGLVAHALWTLGIALAVALPLVLLTLGMGLPLVLGGKAMRRSGTDAEREIRETALLSMLFEKGRASAAQAASALGMRVDEADALLTALAKSQPEQVAIDIGEEGTVWYRPAAGVGATAFRVRVDESSAHAQAEAEAEAAEVDVARPVGEKTVP
jgi:hypothetical protein